MWSPGVDFVLPTGVDTYSIRGSRGEPSAVSQYARGQGAFRAQARHAELSSVAYVPSGRFEEGGLWGGVTRRVGLGLPQSYEVGLSPIGVGLSPMGIGLAAVVDRVDEHRFW
jgi:hypothetical protein